MASDDINLIGLKHSLGRLGDHGLAELRGHDLCITLVQAQFPSDFPVRSVQSHEVLTQHPDLGRLMSAREDRARQVVEPPVTSLAKIPLAVGLRIIAAILDDGRAGARRTADPVRPAILSDHRETRRVVDQGLEIDHIRIGHGGDHARRAVATKESITPRDRNASG